MLHDIPKTWEQEWAFVWPANSEYFEAHGDECDVLHIVMRCALRC